MFFFCSTKMCLHLTLLLEYESEWNLGKGVQLDITLSGYGLTPTHFPLSTILYAYQLKKLFCKYDKFFFRSILFWKWSKTREKKKIFNKAEILNQIHHKGIHCTQRTIKNTILTVGVVNKDQEKRLLCGILYITEFKASRLGKQTCDSM